MCVCHPFAVEGGREGSGKMKRHISAYGRRGGRYIRSERLD